MRQLPKHRAAGMWAGKPEGRNHVLGKQEPEVFQLYVLVADGGGSRR